MQINNKELTGYPSIDKPWLKYYSEEAINAPLPEMTLYEYAWENNKNYLKDIAFRYYGTKITYGEFFENAKLAARAFTAMGVKKGDIVTIMSMHTPETIYAFYGLNYIGAVANMVYMTLSGNEILHTLKETQSKLFMVLDAAAEKVGVIRDKISIPIVMLSVADSMPVYMKAAYRLKYKKPSGHMTWRKFLAKGRDVSFSVMATDHKSMAVIVYTSGTTGEPKGVMLSDDNINNIAFQDFNGIIGFRRNLTFLFMLPPFIGFGLAHLCVGVSAGLTLILQIDLTPRKVSKMLFKNKIDVFLTGPAFIDSILGSGISDLDNLKYFICGGGEISNEKEREVNRFLRNCKSKASYSNGYGMTEAASVLCTNCNQISKIGSIGLPFCRTNVKVIDTESGKELGYRKEGELYFSTPSLMEGYYKNDEATNKTIIVDEDGTRWLRTGDLGYVDEDGFVFLKGRLKRIFYARASMGEICRLFPSHIEEVMEKSGSVASCAVIVKEDKERISVPIVYITLKDTENKDDQDKHISDLFVLSRKELPEHMQPDRIIIIDKMPLTPSGKIDYRKLEEMDKELNE